MFYQSIEIDVERRALDDQEILPHSDRVHLILDPIFHWMTEVDNEEKNQSLIALFAHVKLLVHE